MDINILVNTQYFFLQPEIPGTTVYLKLPFLSILASNDYELRNKKLYHDEIVTYFGVVITKNNYDFGFVSSEISNESVADLNAVRKAIGERLSCILVYFEEFLSYLWFAKDHNATSKLSFGYLEENIKPTLVGFENSRSCTMADGQSRDTHFSQADVDIAIEIINKISKIYPNTKSAKDIITPIEIDEKKDIKTKVIRSLDDHTHYYDYNRIQRALSLLSILRGVAFIPYKLSLYIPILESLFSPSDGELSFKVSQRVAFYIGKDMAEKKAIFEQVKRVYEIRSRFLHGQAFEKKSKKLDFREESKNMDNILRRILKKVIMEDSAIFLGNDLEKHLTDFVFRDRDNSPKIQFE